MFEKRQFFFRWKRTIFGCFFHLVIKWERKTFWIAKISTRLDLYIACRISVIFFSYFFSSFNIAIRWNFFSGLVVSLVRIFYLHSFGRCIFVLQLRIQVEIWQWTSSYIKYVHQIELCHFKVCDANSEWCSCCCCCCSVIFELNKKKNHRKCLQYRLHINWMSCR